MGQFWGATLGQVEGDRVGQLKAPGWVNFGAPEQMQREQAFSI